MARRPEHLQTLRALVDIRAAQKQATGAEFAHAARTLARTETRLDAERDLQAERLDAWSATVATARLDLQLSIAWAQALVQGKAAVDLATRSAQRATQLRDAARHEAWVADARHEVAEDMTTGAVRDTRRRTDERAIASAEDHFSWRRVAP